MRKSAPLVTRIAFEDDVELSLEPGVSKALVADVKKGNCNANRLRNICRRLIRLITETNHDQ